MKWTAEGEARGGGAKGALADLPHGGLLLPPQPHRMEIDLLQAALLRRPPEEGLAFGLLRARLVPSALRRSWP